jgi:2-octaprenylphenol hydroxylase
LGFFKISSLKILISNIQNRIDTGGHGYSVGRITKIIKPEIFTIGKLVAMKHSVIIVGAGIVGLTVALDLAQRGRTVTVLDRNRSESASRPIHDLDSRIYAIRPGLVRYLNQLKLWEQIDTEHIQPIYSMWVKGSSEKSVLDFDAIESGVDSLALTVEESRLARALNQTCATNDNISFKTNCDFEGVDFRESDIIVRTNQGELHSKLLIAADGAQSSVRDVTGIGFEVKDYQSLGIVANFKTEKSHGGRAYQIFSDEGILALLPLPGNRISIVWSLPESIAQNILSGSDEDLSDLIFRRFDALGPLRCITPARSFPLRRGMAREYTAERVVLMGDALRHIHPLAGQGLNLGLADARTIGELVGAAKTDDPGSRQILRRYARARREETIIFSEFTDLMSGVFSGNKLWSSVGNMGFRLVNQCPPLKRYFVNRAVN